MEKSQEREEVEKILENMIRQLKNSGWERGEIQEIIVSGYRGWRSRLERREAECGLRYRSAGKSLITRARKKLTGKVDWYKTAKNKRKREDDEDDKDHKDKRRKHEEEGEDGTRIVSVMFIPFTVGGELSRRLKAAESELAKQTGVKIKIVEKVGTKLVDLLHQSDPWQGADCERNNCLVCRTKVETEKGEKQDCTVRNIVYETWCLSCEKAEKERLEKIMEEEEKTHDNAMDSKEKKVRNITLYKYIGESARSGYERGLEHLRDYTELKKESHMLKHYLDKHEKEDMENVKFGMRIIKKARSAFERQVSESVQIQIARKGNFILNSKSEYNRCALPRLTARIGNFTVDDLEKKKKVEAENEKVLLKKIRDLKIRNSKSRRDQITSMSMPAIKRRKVGHCKYKRVISQEPPKEKRKQEEGEEVTLSVEEGSPVPKRRVCGGGRDPILLLTQEPDLLDPLENPAQARPQLGPKGRTEEEEKAAQAAWEEKLRIREERIKEEERIRIKKINLAERMSRSWHLLNLCRETMKREGLNWEKSKERREEERTKMLEKDDRMKKAAGKKKAALEKHHRKELQTKITTQLKLIPKNRRILLEREIEKERIWNLKEAKLELWRRWRQRKGRIPGQKSKKDLEVEDLETKLKKIEEEIHRMEDELEKELVEVQEKAEKKEKTLEKKRKKERHWEMLKWTVEFIEEHKHHWEKEKKRKREEKEEEEENLELWMTLGKAEKIEMLKKEEENSNKSNMDDEYLERIKEERIRTALSVKETWNSWRKVEREDDDDEVELLDLHDHPDLRSAVTKDSPGWSNTLPIPKVTPEKLGGGDQGGRGADQEIRKESIAHHNAGLLSEVDDQEDQEHAEKEDEEAEKEIEHLDLGQDCRSFCYLCASYPCLCDILKLEMKMSYLSGSYVELEGREKEESTEHEEEEVLETSQEDKTGIKEGNKRLVYNVILSGSQGEELEGNKSDNPEQEERKEDEEPVQEDREEAEEDLETTAVGKNRKQRLVPENNLLGNLSGSRESELEETAQEDREEDGTSQEATSGRLVDRDYLPGNMNLCQEHEPEGKREEGHELAETGEREKEEEQVQVQEVRKEAVQEPSPGSKEGKHRLVKEKHDLIEIRETIPKKSEGSGGHGSPLPQKIKGGWGVTPAKIA